MQKKIFACFVVLGMLLGANYAHATTCISTTVSSTGLVDSDGLVMISPSTAATSCTIGAGTLVSIDLTTP